MDRPLFALFTKEVRVIFRDPTVLIGTILVPLVLFPVMGSAIHVGVEATERQLAELQIAFYSHDAEDGNGTHSLELYALLSASNTTVRNVTAESTSAALNWTLANGLSTLVVVPSNFSEAIDAGHSAEVSVFQVLHNFGPGEAGGSARVDAALSTLNAKIASDRVRANYPNSTADEALFPARARTSSVIQGQVRSVAPEIVLNTILSGALTLPIVLSVMIVMSAQLAATSVAAEKEQKTLEVLLTLPTRRENILLGKLAGVFVVAVVGTITIFFGFSSYTGSISAGLPTADPAAAGLVPDAQGYALLVATLLLAFVSALSLAVLVASYAKDIYGAQSLMGIVYLPVFLPSILLSFTPLEILPPAIEGAVLAIPFSYPSLAGKALFTHDYGLLYLGLVYQLAFMAVVLFLAARMFSTEKVLTARLSLGKRKRKPSDEE